MNEQATVTRSCMHELNQNMVKTPRFRTIVHIGHHIQVLEYLTSFFLGCEATIFGASTCISRELNSRAKMGLDNKTRTLCLCASDSATSPDPVLPFLPSEHPLGSVVLGLQILAGLTGRTLHSTLQEYLRRSGWSSVWPLKLGSDILIAGPIHLLCLCDSAATSATGRVMLHKCLADDAVVSEISIPWELSRLENVEPMPRRFRNPFVGFTNGLFPGASVCENLATWLGSPTSYSNESGDDQ